MLEKRARRKTLQSTDNRKSNNNTKNKRNKGRHRCEKKQKRGDLEPMATRSPLNVPCPNITVVIPSRANTLPLIFESDLVRSVLQAIFQSANDHPMVFLSNPSQYSMIIWLALLKCNLPYSAQCLRGSSMVSYCRDSLRARARCGAGCPLGCRGGACGCIQDCAVT